MVIINSFFQIHLHMQCWRENFSIDFHQIRIHTYKLCQYTFVQTPAYSGLEVSEAAGVREARPVVHAFCFYFNI